MSTIIKYSFILIISILFLNSYSSQPTQIFNIINNSSGTQYSIFDIASQEFTTVDFITGLFDASIINNLGFDSNGNTILLGESYYGPCVAVMDSTAQIVNQTQIIKWPKALVSSLESSYFYDQDTQIVIGCGGSGLNNNVGVVLYDYANYERSFYNTTATGESTGTYDPISKNYYYIVTPNYNAPITLVSFNLATRQFENPIKITGDVPTGFVTLFQTNGDYYVLGSDVNGTMAQYLFLLDIENGYSKLVYSTPNYSDYLSAAVYYQDNYVLLLVDQTKHSKDTSIVIIDVNTYQEVSATVLNGPYSVVAGDEFTSVSWINLNLQNK